MFLSTYDKQLDVKRRLVVPADYRPHGAADFDGVYLFPSLMSDCLEAGGQALFEAYQAMADERPFGDPVRDAIEWKVFGKLHKLAFDGAGRITLPESLCDAYGLGEWVTIIGLRDRFQLWSREAFAARDAEQGRIARQGVLDMRAAQWSARLSRSQ